jgi:hypothetical protein
MQQPTTEQNPRPKSLASRRALGLMAVAALSATGAVVAMSGAVGADGQPPTVPKADARIIGSTAVARDDGGTGKWVGLEPIRSVEDGDWTDCPGCGLG